MNIYRKGSKDTIVVAVLKEFEYNGTYMGERVINATLKSPEIIDFIVGDYVIYTIDGRQEEFVLNKIPSVKKISSSGSIGNAFEYTLSFYGLQYELTTVQMRDITENDDNVYTGMPDFTFYGDAKELCSRISANLRERFFEIDGNGKKVGLWKFDLSEDALNSDSYELSFQGENCFDALSKLNDETTFNLKFTIENRTIKVGYKPKVVSLANGYPFYFKYGKSSHKSIENGGGLYSIERIPDEKDIITRLRAYGGTQNVNIFYNRDDKSRFRYSPRVMLPEYNINGKDYIDADQDVIDYYGIREGSMTFDDIYPSIKDVKLGDFPENIITIEVTFRSGSAYLKLYRYEEYGLKKEVNATTNVLVTIHNESSKRAVVLIKKGAKEAICIDKDDNSIVFNYEDDFYFTDVRIESTNLHSDNGIYYVPYCYSPAKSIDYNAEDRIDEIVAFNQPEKYKNGDVFEIYVRDLGFEIGRTFDYDVDTIANVWHLNGTSIVFNSGLLGGEEFELAATTDNTTKVERLSKEHLYYSLGARYVIRLKYKIDEYTNYRMPNEVLFPKGGDRFVITGMDMPLLYHYWAEDKLLAEAQKYLKENSTIEHKYAIEFDNIKLAMHPTISMQICEGNSITIIDNDLKTKQVEESNLILKKGENILGVLGYFNNYKRFNTNKESKLSKELIVSYLDEGDYTLLSKSIKSNNGIEFYTKHTKNSDKVVLDTILENESYSKIINVSALQETTRAFNGKKSWLSPYKIGDCKTRIENNETIYYDDNGVGVEFCNIEEKTLTDTSGNKYQRYIYTAIRGDNETSLKKRFMRLYSECRRFSNDNTNESTYVAYNDEHSGTIRFELRSTIIPEVINDYDSDWNVIGTIPFKLIVMYVDGNDAAQMDFYDFERISDNSNDYKANVKIDDFKFKYGVDLYLCIGTSSNEKFSKLKSCPASFYLFINSGYSKTITIREREGLYINTLNDYESEIDIEDTLLIKGIHEYDSTMNSAVIDIEKCTIKVECSDDFSPNPDKKTYSATLSNKTEVSGWQVVKSDIKDNRIDIENSKKDIDSLVQTSRNTQENLNVLENNIFDPDGNIQNTFLSTMMLQVGADSMNYYLKLTRITVWGDMNNIDYDKDNDVITFNKDILYHYEYKCGGEQGNWSIERASSFDLRNGGEYFSADKNGDKVFFVAICCNKNNLTDAFWIVSDNTDMIKVENDMFPNYYVFNYAIISAMEKDENGNVIKYRMITETRGKSYMYGDNIVTGKISSMNGMTWINLVDGSFNFGDKLILDSDGNLISSGMVLADRITVRDSESEKDDKTVAGMNGVLDQTDRLESPAFWAGGTYEEALNDKTQMMINHKGLGRIGVIRYYAEWILVKSKDFFNTIISSVDINRTLSGIKSDIQGGVIFAPKLPIIRPTLTLRPPTNTQRPQIWSGSIDSVRLDSTIFYADTVYFDIDYDIPNVPYYVYFDSPIDYVNMFLYDFCIQLSDFKSLSGAGDPYYWLKYRLKFELYLNNEYGDTRIGSFEQTEWSYLFQQESKPTQTLWNIEDNYKYSDWNGFQFDGSGDKDSFLLLDAGKRVKIGLKTTIYTARHGFKISFYRSLTPRLMLQWMGTMRYRIRECATIIAEDGMSMMIGDDEHFSIRHEDTSGIDSLKWSFVGKVRQSSLVYREGKLQSLPNGILILNNGDYSDTLIPKDGFKYRIPTSIVLDVSSVKTESNITIGEVKYTGSYFVFDLKEYSPYDNPVIANVCGKVRIWNDLNQDGVTSTSDWWIQNGNILYINTAIKKTNGVMVILIY